MTTEDQLRVHQIILKQMGAFRDFEIDLEGRHALIYGDNGSGKTSLARLLRAWIWSASVVESTKVHALFARGVGGNMVNLKAVAEAEPTATVDASMSIEVCGTPPAAAGTYKLSFTDHETHAAIPLRKADMASDFINYRVFYEMFRGQSRQPLNLWPVFLAEILPFCASAGSTHANMAEHWEFLASADPVQEARLAGAAPHEYRTYYRRHDEALVAFELELRTQVAAIAQQANHFYKKNFAPRDAVAHSFELAAQVPKFNRRYKISLAPSIYLAVHLGAQDIPAPHMVLNEAELTKLAISIHSHPISAL